jgi:hypothetical protein
MKQFYSTSKIAQLVLLFAIIAFSNLSYGQALIPHLSFRNATLISGTDGADNAIYRFPSVTNGVDALVKINGRSSANVVLSNIDINNTGYDSAFQPLVNYTNGSKIKSGVVTDWYLEYQISFVTAGTILPTIVAAFNATVLDDDGNPNLHEYVSLYGLNTFTLENPTGITASNILQGKTVLGKRFDGDTVEFSGIDVTATTVMATTTYLLTNSFTVRTGGVATGPINIDNNGRQYSLWFKSFNYTAPVTGTLPITLNAFTAKLENSGSKVDLNWQTTTEINASHFVIQRSTDGTNYTDDAMVFTQEGNSNLTRYYQYTDKLNGLNATMIYYRLKMVDMDGDFKYSNVEVVRLDQTQGLVSVTAYPNPATSEISVTIPESWQNKTVSYSIYSLSGTLVRTRTNANAQQTETFAISDLSKGIYLINTSNGVSNTTQKFIKMN